MGLKHSPPVRHGWTTGTKFLCGSKTLEICHDDSWLSGSNIQDVVNTYPFKDAYIVTVCQVSPR